MNIIEQNYQIDKSHKNKLKENSEFRNISKKNTMEISSTNISNKYSKKAAKNCMIFILYYIISTFI